MFYERFHNGEIMAGNYAVRVSPLSANFVRMWESMHSIAENVSFSNGDNGALHLQMINFLKDELNFPQGKLASAEEAITRLKQHYLESRDLGSYDRYVAMARLALGPVRNFTHVIILRRGQGFCQDFFFAAPSKSNPQILCYHGFKSPEALIDEVGQECASAMTECKSSLKDCGHDLGLQQAPRDAKIGRMALGNVNDIANCWPHCPVNIPAKEWKVLASGLAKNAECPLDQSVFGCCCGVP